MSLRFEENWRRYAGGLTHGVTWGLGPTPHICHLEIGSDQAVKKATDIEMADVRAETHRGWRGDRGVDATGSGKA